MKNRIAYLFLGALSLAGLASCDALFEDAPSVKTRTVYFSTADDAQTRTGITIEDKVVTPDWRKTAPANVHIFETGGNGGVSEGEDVEITVASDNLTASFKADFPTQWTIIVDPSEGESDSKSGGSTKAETDNGPYTYSAVVAQKDGESGPFVVPAVQYPDSETLIDPDADFLIGYSRKSYSEPHDWQENVVDLYFDRPVALSRISVTNFEAGEKVKSVTIKAQAGLTGSAAYSDIDFENASVSFASDSESGSIELNYGSGMEIASGGSFEAYFISLPGTVKITALEVVTDKYQYTKTIEGGKDFTFNNNSFKTIKLDLATATKEEAGPNNTVWYKASVLEDGIDYLIVSQGYALNNGADGVTGVAVSDNNGSIEFSDSPEATLIWTAEAKVISADNDLIAGHFILMNGGKYLQRVSSGTHEYVIGVGDVPSTVKYYAWDYDGDYLFHVSNSSATFYCYYDGGWQTGYQNQKSVNIYTTRAPQELAFTPDANAEYDLATSEWVVAVPTLSGAKSAVTYALSEDSNPAVATVDADGTVHPLSRGTVTIVATAVGNDQYQAASVSYKLRVVNSNVTTNTYYKVTSTGDLEVGTQYLLVYEGESKVFKPILESSSSTTFTKSTDNALNAEISGSTITSNEFEDCHLTLESGYYLKADAAGKYLYPDVASSRGVLSAESTASHSLNVTIAGDGVASIITKTGTYYMVWSTSSKYFSSSTDIEGSYSTGICLYKLDDGRLHQTLSFTPDANAEYDLGTSTWTVAVPTLNGVQTSVTYALSEDSNPEVATVDADGTVHPISKGTVTIVATAAGNDQYHASSASYTLRVVDSSVSIPTWYKAEEIEDGETYLIVSNGYALQNNGGSAAAVAVDENDGIIVFDAPESAVFTATASSGKFTLRNNGQYMQRGGSSGSYVPSFSSSQGSYYQWTYDSASEFVTATGNNTYYVYYSTSNSKWSMGTSGGDSRKAALYTSTPPRATQDLVFSSTSVEFDFAGTTTFTAPTLSGAQTSVTYSSNKPAVATVDAATGAVEIVGTGTTVITASAEGTADYKPATASYTLRVIDSSAPVTTKRFVLADAIEDGKSYIIVSNGYALKNDGGSVASVAVTPEDGAIEFDPGEEDDLAWTAESNSTIPEVGDYTFTNNSYRINRKSSSGSFSLTFVASSSSVDRYQLWLLKEYSGNSYLYHNSNSSQAAGYTYYIYYNSGWKITASNSSNPTSTEKPTQLYVEE